MMQPPPPDAAIPRAVQFRTSTLNSVYADPGVQAAPLARHRLIAQSQIAGAA